MRNVPNNQLQYAFERFVASVREHYQAMLQTSLVGDNPNAKFAKAVLFEVGCLHLYLLDHGVRQGRLEDVVLMELWQGLGHYLLGMFPGSENDENYGRMLSARLARYEEVSLPVEDDTESYGPQQDLARLDDILYTLARQLTLCIGADGSMMSQVSEANLFMGVVREDNMQMQADPLTLLAIVREIKATLYVHALPLRQTALLWAHGRVFYEKSVEELNGLAEQGTEQAVNAWHKHQTSKASLADSTAWMQMLDAKMRFVLAATVNKPLRRRLDVAGIVERDVDGRPYLRIIPHAQGVPLRRLLLMAHDVAAGLVTTNVAPDDATGDLYLSLGEVDGLLRGLPLVGGDVADVPDFSDPSQVRVSFPDAWRLSRAVRRALYETFVSIESVVDRKPSDDPEDPDQPGSLVELVRKIKAEDRIPVDPIHPEDRSVLRASWIDDASGAGALVLSPIVEALQDYLAWLMPPGMAVMGEHLPQYARYALGYSHDNREGKLEPFHPQTRSVILTMYNPNTRFVRTNEIVYGGAGEPYEVVRVAGEEEGGKPILDFALPCYDLGHGIVLRGAMDKIVWWCSFGDVIQLLWDGALLPYPPSEVPTVEDRLTDAPEHSTLPPVEPDYLSVPGIALENICWALRQTGVTLPRMGLVPAETGRQVLCFGPEPANDARGWVAFRTNWYLPRSVRSFAFANHPGLIPFEVPG